MTADEKGRPIDAAIEELETLRRTHGGSIELLSSKGGVGFKFVSFSQEEREREGLRNCIGIIDDNGSML